jgi:hypothetical protein
MSKVIRNGKMYQCGSMIDHCLYLNDGFEFDCQAKTKYKKLIRNGKTVKV